MNAWELPTSLEVGGKEYPIRTDFRAVLDILIAIGDPELFEPDSSEEEKNAIILSVVLEILYVDMPPAEHIEEAYKKACEFIDAGMETEDKTKPIKMMDWQQDAGVLIPAVNRVAGKEIRSMEYLHWWTFLGYYMEIGESLFSEILNIRDKKAHGKKLEKWEREFYSKNKGMIDFKNNGAVHLTDKEKDEVRKLFGLK